MLLRPPHLLSLLLAGCLLAGSGCTLILPEVSHQPVLHNPFPQLSRVAVAPFFNQSDERTVDGREFAMAYFGELQSVRGFEVVPVGVVEEAIIRHAVDLSSPGEARRLANLLGVDAVVVGAVTDYSIYYPPRCGMRVEWYAANPGFHPIPAGYGLPWGTPDEEYIPDDLVFAAEMELARKQMATQSPECYAGCESLPAPPAFDSPNRASQIPTQAPLPLRRPAPTPTSPFDHNPGIESLPAPRPSGQGDGGGGWDAAGDGGAGGDAEGGAPRSGGFVGEDEDEEPEAADGGADGDRSAKKLPRSVTQTSREGASASNAGGVPSDASATTEAFSVSDSTDATPPLPPEWPDARGFSPPGPSPVRPPCLPSGAPVMTHTRVFRGADPDFTSALASYVSFRDEARFGGWQSYLERRDDFIRFCAHLHLAEMLTARGGGGETRVVRRWSESR